MCFRFENEPVHSARLRGMPLRGHAMRMRCLIFIVLAGLTAQTAIAAAAGSRWGALAFGGDGFGATRGRPDEKSAIDGALRQCVESGGGDQCEIRLTYRDRCVAYAAGENREAGIAYSQAIESAIRLAERTCSEAAANCRIQYAACSLSSSFN